MKKEYLDGRIIAYCGDCLNIMPEIKDVDCVLTDPPYNGIVKNKWDNQWESMADFQEWVGQVGSLIYDCMKDNASFYWFGDDKNVAYCQVELDKRFRLLNSVVWRKIAMQTMKGAETVYRSFAPITERCLLYDKGEDKTGLEMIDREYVAPRNPFSLYLKSEFEKAGVSRKEIAGLFRSASGGLTGCVSNWLNGENVITKEQYLKIRKYLNNEYLRKEYESLRRTWNNDKKAYDVLDFPICQEKGRFLKTQKPLPLIEYLLERSTNKDDLVLDVFGGSGTTAVACIRLGRKCTIIEKDPEMFEKMCNRIEEAIIDKKSQLF